MSGMRGFEFMQYFDKIRHVRQLFLKVISIDQIPKVIPIKHFLICNLSPADSPGSHWIVIVRSENDTLEIYNSLGTPSLDYLLPFLKFRKKYEITYNQEQFQSNSSTNCGFFCIYFIVQRVLNFDMSFEDILELIFETNFEINEQTVVQFCHNLIESNGTNILS
jgi:hypothetical protein